ncbi:hypothetical protein OFY17_00075 [Marinomonas sp. C2222]|uniref:Uncharacterized protein n=1 Tax=Marinomonas sargassi TaxID=2984494 RepID=A0ABT2YN03_9GAMM|nr:hypothetical protein [Marinomonas sargassi]MCV2401268.1 hypothetical protein [Marinomonas sargassi]
MTRFIRLSNILLICVFSATHLFAAPVVSKLQSDGPNQGLEAYDLIRQFAGPKPIESPDLYSGNHTGVKHIFERTDDIVGHHFVFTIHKHEDKDRNKFTQFSDRQRNEIKAYSGSKDDLKGFESETLSYSWKFKVGEGMSVSKNFTHLFQLKSVDDGIGTPILTVSAALKKGQENLFLSHAAVKKTTFLASYPWNDVHNKWLQANCKVTYGNQGKLNFSLAELETGKEVFSYQSDNIDMWRGTKSDHFVRPKWGIYRSLKSKHMLRDQEEQVSFADFIVTKYK